MEKVLPHGLSSFQAREGYLLHVSSLRRSPREGTRESRALSAAGWAGPEPSLLLSLYLTCVGQPGILKEILRKIKKIA